MSDPLLVCTTTSEAEMRRLSGALAPRLKAGDVLRLQGALGAGKTVFARGIIQTLAGADEEVPSPTFSLVQTYDTRPAPIWHLDLYRLEKPNDIWELGLEDALETAISLIEWPDKADALVPPCALTVEIALIAETGRKVTFSSAGDHRQGWSRRLQGLKTEAQGIKT